ncbi:MAG: hypothetical protein IID39_02375 [Planctomycetes bacterium]|nr:hypothetical protein [Planctomycetota bacterium]
MGLLNPGIKAHHNARSHQDEGRQGTLNERILANHLRTTLPGWSVDARRSGLGLWVVQLKDSTGRTYYFNINRASRYAQFSEDPDAFRLFFRTSVTVSDDDLMAEVDLIRNSRPTRQKIAANLKANELKPGEKVSDWLDQGVITANGGHS